MGTKTIRCLFSASILLAGIGLAKVSYDLLLNDPYSPFPLTVGIPLTLVIAGIIGSVFAFRAVRKAHNNEKPQESSKNWKARIKGE